MFGESSTEELPVTRVQIKGCILIGFILEGGILKGCVDRMYLLLPGM